MTQIPCFAHILQLVEGAFYNALFFNTDTHVRIRMYLRQSTAEEYDSFLEDNANNMNIAALVLIKVSCNNYCNNQHSNYF